MELVREFVNQFLKNSSLVPCYQFEHCALVHGLRNCPMSNILWVLTPPLALIPSAYDGICCVGRETGERFVPL